MPEQEAEGDAQPIRKFHWPSSNCWNITLATLAIVFTVVFGLPAWLSLYAGSDSAENVPVPQDQPDPITAMICVEFYDHPLVQQSGQCAGVSLTQLESLAMRPNHKTPSSRSFENFLVVREIERSTKVREESRKWPANAIGLPLVYPTLPTDTAHPGKDWVKFVGGHYFKEWATIIWDQHIPITHHVLALTDPDSRTWTFQTSQEFFGPKSVFDMWDQYLFAIASISDTEDCFGCIDAEIPLVYLKHPFKFTLQDKAESNPLLNMDAMDCDMLKRWSTNQRWRLECGWPEVYQNYTRLKEEGYLDEETPLGLNELSDIVKRLGWTWRTRPYKDEL